MQFKDSVEVGRESEIKVHPVPPKKSGLCNLAAWYSRALVHLPTLVFGQSFTRIAPLGKRTMPLHKTEQRGERGIAIAL